MNYKIIAIFTLLLLVSGTLVGIPFGFWLANDELIINSPMYHLGQYAAGFVVEFIVFYVLYRKKINKPIHHASIIGILSLAISISLLYVLTGILKPPLLVAVDLLITVSAIFLALHAANIRGKFSVSA